MDQNLELDLAHAISERAAAMDRRVGLRIRQRRVELGMSQQQLARTIGVTYQQAHKYERGLNRISAGRLFEAARVLDVTVNWFFEVPENGAVEADRRARQAADLARNLGAIDDDRARLALGNLARALARHETGH